MKPWDLEPCTPYAWGGHSLVGPWGGAQVTQGVSRVTRELRRSPQKIAGNRKNQGDGRRAGYCQSPGGGSALCWLRPVPFTSEAPGGRPRSGGGGGVKADGGDGGENTEGRAAEERISALYARECDGGENAAAAKAEKALKLEKARIRLKYSPALVHELRCDCGWCLNGRL